MMGSRAVPPAAADGRDDAYARVSVYLPARCRVAARGVTIYGGHWRVGKLGTGRGLAWLGRGDVCP
jgi:hypothetical protein